MADQIVSIGFHIDDTEVKAFQSSLESIGSSAAKLDDSQTDVKSSASNLMTEFAPTDGNDPAALFSNLPAQMGSSYRLMFSAAQREAARLNELLSADKLSADMTASVRQSLGFQTANIRTLVSSAQQIGGVFNGISDGMKNDFAAAIGDMMKNASMVQRADKWMSKSTSGLSDRGFAAMLQADAPFASGLQAIAKQFQLSPRDTANLLEGIVKHSVPALRRATYFEDAQAASGGQIKRMPVIPEVTDFRERLPARYHDLPVDPRDVKSLAAMPKHTYAGQLSPEEYRLVKQVAASNPSFEQALIATGLAQRSAGKNRAAVLKMPHQPISRAEYAGALGYMYRDMLVPALEGAPAYYRSISSADGFDQTRIANKNSRVPREVYQAAAMLDAIDVSPSFEAMSPVSRRKMSPVRGASSVTIRPDSFQVASLTLDDFRAGRVLDASAGYKFGFDEDRHDDGSIYKIINRSGYTDLLGMRGHNTFGDGRGGDAKSPRMMLINVGDRLLAKDSSGNLVFADDGPARDDDTRRALTAMFERRADLPYRHAGVDSVYKYPVVEYGDGARYVPTNVKGTNIVLSREDVYRKASLPFLNKYGVNVFDNLMDMDTEFSTVETMTKRTEARNRMMTPSVPMTELGGRMPAKNRFAFVDLSSVSGLDGAMMFMPGFIPGDNATIRAPGIKGQAQTVDFHKMIKDLYGPNTTSFYLPAMNAPKEAKEIFSDPSRGIEYARKHYSPEQFADYFLDIMQYDALITDSVIKSDFFRDVKNPRTGAIQHKGNAELQRRLTDVLGLLGDGSFRVYETADGFWTDGKISLSSQMSQGLSLTEADVKENDRLWNEYMRDLQDPSKVIGMLFSDQTDPVSKRVTANPGQLWQDKEAQSRISQALSSARLARARGELFGRGNLAMGVALANPGEWIMAAAKGNRLAVSDPKLAEVLSLAAADGTQGTIAAAKWRDTDYIGAGRYPNNTMEAFSLANSMAYIDLLKKYGMSTSGIYMNMDTIKRMGGGDFDGDTVQLVRKRLQETIARTFTERKQQLNGYVPNKDALRVETETLATPRVQQASDMADMLYRNAVSTFKMSQVSTASDALSQGNWNDPNWVKRYGRAGLDLRAMYDIDSTFAKTGVAAKWTQYAQNARYGLGKPFAHAFKGLAGAVDNGRLDQIADLSAVNFPSIYNALTVSSLAALGDAPVVDSLIAQLVEMQSAKQGIPAMLASPDKRLQARGQYLQKNLSVMSDLLTGRAQGVSASDQDEQEGQLAIWAREADVAPTTKARDEDSPERREEIRAIKQQYARLDFARDFGLTERNIASNAGYANVGMFKNARMSGQHSTFQRVANEEAARLQTQAAIIAGTEFTTVSALQAAELSKRVNEGIRRYNGESIGPGRDQRGFQYSVSMLRSLENNPEEWYRQRVKGIRSPETIDAALGTAAHAAMEAYLKRRMVNDSDYGKPEEFETLFNESLVKSGQFGADLEGLNAHGAKFASKVSNARAFVRSQPTLFRDEVILGSETVVRPLFGYQIDPVTGQQTMKPLPSLGKIDVVSKKKLQDGTLGPVMFTELKPTKDDAGALRQMRSYGEARGDEQNPHPGRPGMLRVIGYNDPIYETQPGAMSAQEVPYDQAAAEADVAHFQKLAKGIQTFALAGLPEQEIDKYLGQYQVQRDAQTHSIVQDQLNPRRAEVFGERPPLPGPTVEETRSHQQQQSALEIDENTGKGIARGIALQEEQFSYGDELSKLRGTFISKERAAENGKLSVSQWDRYAHMLDETNGTYYWKRKELKDKGASETDLALLDQERKETYDAYQRALRSSSYADLETFTKATNDARSSMNVSSNVGSLIKQFTDLEDAIVRASSAYGTLQADLQQKASVGEKITEEDTKALERAQAAMVDAQNAKSAYQAALQTQAKDKAQGLVNQAILPFATKEERNQIGQAQHLAQLNQAFSTAEATISDLESKGLISPEDASAMRQRMSAVTPAQRDALAAGTAYATQRERANAESREQLASIDRARYLRESYRQFADELSPQQQQLAEQERIERENPYWQKATVQRHKERSNMLKLIKQFDDQDAQLTEQLNDPNITKERRSAQERQRRINQKRRNEIEQKYQAKSSAAGFADDISQLHNAFANMGGVSQGDQLINQYEQMQEAQVVAQNKLNEMKSRLRDLQQKSPKKLSDGERNEQKALTKAIPTAEASLQGISDLLAAQQPLQQERGAQLNNRHLDDVLANGARRSPDEIAKRALQDRAHALRSELSKLQAKDAKGEYTHYKNLTEEQRKERIDAYNAAASDDAQNKYGGDIYAQEASRDASTQAHLDYSQASLARRARSLHNATYGTGRGLWGRAMSLYDANLDRYQSESVRLQDAMTKELERQQKLDPNSAAYAKSKDYYNQLNKQKQDVDQQAKQLEGPAGKLLAVSQTVSNSISRVFSRFGYRFFMSVINEIKNFVTQFDSAMTEIQMITMKTDDEIASLGDSLIQTAIDMKVSVSDVTSAAADLYRQGLDDNEVFVRMEDVLKFAKVTGMKTEDASKIITTALSNDLVSSSGEAMDALVAQGDSAATTAAEIAKGMQKSAASAKQAGVSYEQLVTMLTIITSKTQLGGNQAGTALQTLMYRLYKVSEGDDYYDEDGNRVASNDATKALKQLGVSVYDENGNQRGAYDIMVDIARNWNSADTISQEMVLNALGAGRQRSNIATLIQGLAEDDGALAEKYMSLASGSEGITDEKYQAYLGSLNAALTNVKTSFDQLINSFSLSGTATNILDFIAEFIQGLARAEEASGALSAALTVVGTVLAGIALYAHPVATLLGLFAGVTFTAISKAGNAAYETSPEARAEELQQRKQDDAAKLDDINATISRTEELLAVEHRTLDQQNELEKNIRKLKTVFDDLAPSIDNATSSMSDYKGITEQARAASEQLSNETAHRNEMDAVAILRDSLNSSSASNLAQTSGQVLVQTLLAGYPVTISSDNGPYPAAQAFISSESWGTANELDWTKFLATGSSFFQGGFDKLANGEVDWVQTSETVEMTSDQEAYIRALHGLGVFSLEGAPTGVGGKTADEIIEMVERELADYYVNEVWSNSSVDIFGGEHGDEGALHSGNRAYNTSFGADQPILRYLQGYTREHAAVEGEWTGGQTGTAYAITDLSDDALYYSESNIRERISPLIQEYMGDVLSPAQLHAVETQVLQNIIGNNSLSEMTTQEIEDAIHREMYSILSTTGTPTSWRNSDYSLNEHFYANYVDERNRPEWAVLGADGNPLSWGAYPLVGLTYDEALAYQSLGATTAQQEAQNDLATAAIDRQHEWQTVTPIPHQDLGLREQFNLGLIAPLENRMNAKAALGSSAFVQSFVDQGQAVDAETRSIGDALINPNWLELLDADSWITGWARAIWESDVSYQTQYADFRAQQNDLLLSPSAMLIMQTDGSYAIDYTMLNDRILDIMEGDTAKALVPKVNEYAFAHQLDKYFDNLPISEGDAAIILKQTLFSSGYQEIPSSDKERIIEYAMSEYINNSGTTYAESRTKMNEAFSAALTNFGYSSVGDGELTYALPYIASYSGEYIPIAWVPQEDYSAAANDAYWSQRENQTQEAVNASDWDVAQTDRVLQWTNATISTYSTGGQDASGNPIVDAFGPNLTTGLAAWASSDQVSTQLAADRAIMYILSGEGDDGGKVDTVQEVVDMQNLPDYRDLTSLLNQFPRLARILDVVLKKDPNTGRYVTREIEYTGEDGNPATRLQYIANADPSGVYYHMIMSELASGSLSFQGIASANRYSTAQMAAAMYAKALSGERLETEEQEYLSAVIGEEMTGMITRVAPLLLDVEMADHTINRDGQNRFKIELSDNNGQLMYDYSAQPEDVQDWLQNEFDTDAERYNATVDAYLEYANGVNRQTAALAFSATEKQYIETILSNAGRGISGLTTTQRSAGANGIIEKIKTGQLSSYLTQDDTMIQEYASAYQSLSSAMSIQQAIETANVVNADGQKITLFNLDDLQEGTEAYQAVEEALLSAGFTMSEAQNIAKQLNNEIATDGLTSLHLYGDAASEITEQMLKWAGSTREVVNATRDLITTMAQASSNEYYRQQYIGGDRSVETLQAMEQMTGFSVEFLLNNSEIVTGLLPTFQASDLEGMQNMYSSLDIYLDDADLRAALGMDSHDFETGDFDLATAASGLNSNNPAYRDFKAIVAQLALLNGGTLTVSQNEIPITVSSGAITDATVNGTNSESAASTTPATDEVIEEDAPAAASTPAAQATTTTTKTAYTINGPSSIPAVTKSSYDTALDDMLLTDYGFGAGNMTPSGRIAIANNMLGIIDEGLMGDFVQKANQNTRSVYSSTFQNMPMVMALAAAVSGATDSEGNEYDLYDLRYLSPDDEGYQVLDEMLRRADSSAEHALSVIEALDQEMAVAGVQASTIYGDSVEDVASHFAEQTGSIKSATSAYQQFLSIVGQADKEASLYAMWQGGNRTIDVATQLANLYGIEVDDLYTDSGAAAQGHSRFMATNQYDVQTWVDAYGAAALSHASEGFNDQFTASDWWPSNISSDELWTMSLPQFTQYAIDIEGEEFAGKDILAELAELAPNTTVSISSGGDIRFHSNHQDNQAWVEAQGNTGTTDELVELVNSTIMAEEELITSQIEQHDLDLRSRADSQAQQELDAAYAAGARGEGYTFSNGLVATPEQLADYWTNQETWWAEQSNFHYNAIASTDSFEPAGFPSRNISIGDFVAMAESIEDYNGDALDALKYIRDNAPHTYVTVNEDGTYGFSYRNAPQGEISALDQWISGSSSYAQQYGITGLTSLNKYRLAQLMRSKAEQGQFTDLYTSSNSLTQQALFGSTANAGMYGYMTLGLDKYNDEHNTSLNIADLATMTESTVGYAEMKAAIEDMGLAFPEAQKYAQDFIQETEDGVLSLMRVFGDLTDEILEGRKAWSGTDRDRFGAAKEMNSAIDDYAEFNYYREQYNNATDKSALPDFVVEKLMGYTDLSEDDIRAGGTRVDNMLNLAAASYGEAAEVQATEMSQYLENNAGLMTYLSSMSGGLNSQGSYVFTPTQASIDYMSGSGINASNDWITFLSGVHAQGGTVSITPTTVEDQIVDEQGNVTGTRERTVYQIVVNNVVDGQNPDDSAYKIDSEDKYGFGISKTNTSGWKLDTAEELIGEIAASDLTTWMEDKDDATIKGLSSVLEGLPEQAHMSAIIEAATGQRYNIFDLNTADLQGRSEIVAALESEGYSVADAEKAIKSVGHNFYYEGIRAANAYGDATEDVIKVMAQLSGSAEEAASAFQDLFSSMYKISDMKTLQMLWNSGSRSDFVVSGIASMTGMSEKDVRDANNASLVSDRIAAEIGAAEEGYGNHLSGWDQYLTPALMHELGIGVGGSETMSELIPRLTELANGGNENAQALLDLYNAASLDGGSLTVTGVEQLHMNSTKPSSTPLYMTDANGNMIPVTRRQITRASGQISYTAPNAAISEADQWYSNLTGAADGKAVKSMTNLQKYQGASRLWQEVAEKGFVSFYDGASDEIKNEIVGLTGSSGMYAYTAYGLEKAGFSANDLLTVKEGTDEYDRMKTAVSALGLTMHEAQEYVRDFAEESQDSILELNNVWGDFTTSVIENSKQWKGSIDSIVSAIKNMNTAASNAGSAQEARERYLNGDTSPDVYTAIANETGFSYDYVAQDPDGYVSRMMSTFERGSLAQVDSELNALGKAMVDEGNIPVLLSAILSKGGTLDLNFLSKLMSVMPGTQAQQMGAYFSYANHQGGQVAVSPYVDATTGKTYYQFTTTGLKAPKSAWDQQYIDYSTDSYGFGITNFTSLRKLGAAQQMMDIMRAGNLLEWQAGSRQSTIQGYSSVLGSMPQVMQLAAILEGGYKGDHSLMDLAGLAKTDPAAYAEMDRVLRAAGYSAEFAIDAVSDLNSEMLYEGLRATNAYGDSTEQVIQLMQQMEDGAKGAAQAFTNLATAMAGVKDIQGMIWQYENSNLNPQLVADIASRTGLTETQVYNNRELTQQAQATLLASSQEELDAQVHSYDGLVNKLGLSSGSYTTDQIIAFAETGAGKGKWTETELAGFKLMAAVTSDHGYSPTYTVTEASASSAMPEIPAVNAQPVNTGIAWLDGLITFGANLFGFGSNSSSTATPVPAQPRTTATGALGSGTAATYSAADTWVNTQWNGAHQVGLTDLTDAQKIAGAQMIATWASEGTLTENLSAIQLDITRSTLTGLTPTAAAFMDYGQTAESADLTYSDIVGITEESENYQAWEDAYGSRGAFLQAQEAAKDFYEETNDGSARVRKDWDDMTDEVIDGSKRWRGSARDIAAAYKDLNSTLTQVANNQYYREQYRAGKRDDETVEAIASMTGQDTQFVKDHEDVVTDMLDELMANDVELVQAQVSQFDQFQNLDEIAVQMPNIVGVDGSVDFSEAVSRLTGESAAELQTLASLLDAMGFSATIVAEKQGDKTVYRIKVDEMTGLGAGVKPSGGGGGGGKSAVDKLLEEQEREQKLWEHRRKMIQYEETRYQNAGELSNYAIMLGHEADEIQRQIGLREKQIEQLKEQMRKTEEYSDDWYTLRDAIMSGEEALAELINDAEDLDRTLEEVQQQILKLHTDLEGEVLQEIEARIQKERNMLDGTVQMQEIILEAIRERYRKEWELMQEDLNKKREALEEEIAMIDERLQRRKDAEDEAAKYEELSELQRQLALISMDSTRTKDQAELREKIAEIEDELSWDSAEDEAERQKEDLQDQVDAYNDYETEYQEWLDEYLEDANNFAEEVNKVMAMNQEELLAWLSENVEAFSLSLKEAQDQMLRNWTDTFKQMRGIIDTYWTEIAETLSSKEGFLAYMMESDAYKKASDDEKAQMVYNWETMYDDWIAAKKIRDEAVNWDHQDDFETGSGNPTGSGASTTTYYGGYDSEGTWVTGYGVTRGDAEVLARNKGLTGVIYSTTGPVSRPVAGTTGSAAPHRGSGSSRFSQVALAYSNGGYVDYTGVALVHGSPSAPEAFLSADDTALVRSMLDAWQLVMARPTMSNLDGITGKGQHNSIGDVHITITEASFAEDADYEEVARRVGAAFTKELAMQGFRTASFNF